MIPWPKFHDQLSKILLRWFQWGWKMEPKISEVSPALGFRGVYDSGFLWFCKWCKKRFLTKNLSSLTLLYGKANWDVIGSDRKRDPFSQHSFEGKVIGSKNDSKVTHDSKQLTEQPGVAPLFSDNYLFSLLAISWNVVVTAHALWLILFCYCMMSPTADAESPMLSPVPSKLGVGRSFSLNY